ncbi:DNA repair protein RecO [Sinimarinibacterium sp. NLF-5-8]|uniref:DNA repair protein RecO n=1 Tax=Sinimarinibacterium sp. NLF-5-8 TaxID=2698684 RepID=UPI00137B93E6|nr:DNA repair protein RecO [Sinimarinibacterium sp. NLF-5-8]QHS09825.1 DNA repair protein RecO [Sinimarinibacterium sp. NLF-5-8]
MSARVELQPAYLLSLRPYRDSSVLLEALTPEYGRVGLVARGIRSPKSRLRGVLQTFTPLWLDWQRRGELGSLRSAEARAAPVALAGDRVFYGWYCNELLLRLLTRDDPQPRIYALYDTLLPQLTEASDTAHATLRIFEKRLLTELGYALTLPADLQPEQRYLYDWERGPLPAVRGYLGSSLMALRDEHLSDARARSDARHLLQQALRRQLGEAPLRSVELLRQLKTARN